MATADKIFKNVEQFAKHIQRLRTKRGNLIRKTRETRSTRKSVNKVERQVIFEKTGGHCHICGGKIAAEDKWQADHVFTYAHGGTTTLDNYLPAHTFCNNYRWSYHPEEIQWILKLGVWLRYQIELEDNNALDLAERFINYEVRRDARRKK